MKNLFKTKGITIVAIVIISLSINHMYAQIKHEPPPRKLPDSTQVVKMMEKLSKELSLSESLKTKITDLHHSHFTEARVLMDKQRAEQEKNRKNMDALRKKFEIDIIELLSDEQMIKFEKFIKSRHQHDKGKQRPHNGNR